MGINASGWCVVCDYCKLGISSSIPTKKTSNKDSGRLGYNNLRRNFQTKKLSYMVGRCLI